MKEIVIGAAIVTLALSVAMLLHWMSGHEFVRSEELKNALVQGVGIGAMGVILRSAYTFSPSRSS